MEITPHKLYDDKTWVNLDFGLADQEQKALLDDALAFYRGLAIPDVNAGFADMEPKSFFNRSKDIKKCLAVQLPLGDLQYQARITISSFETKTVAGCYKEILGEDIAFEAFHSPDARRRSLVTRLRNLTLIDQFSMVDQSIDELYKYVIALVQGLIEVQPEF